MTGEVRTAREEEQKRRNELLALNSIAQAVSASLDLDQVLSAALERVIDVTGADAGIVYLWDPEVELLRVRAHRGLSPAYVGGVDRIRMGEGLVGKVAESGEPIVVEDVLSDPRIIRPEYARGEGIKSILMVPLKSKAATVGMYYVAIRQLRRFTPGDVDLMVSVGHQIATAIGNATLFQEAVEQTGRLQALIRTAGRLTGLRQTGDLLSGMAGEAARLLEVEGAGFRLLEGDRLIVAGRYGLANEVMLTPSIRSGESLSGLILREDRPIAVPDLREDQTYLPAHKRAAIERGVAGFLGVPLRQAGKVIGALHVYSKKRRVFNSRDIALLAAFADLAAVAIANARLFEETRAQAEALAEKNRQLLVLHIAARFLSTEHDPRRLLQRIVDAATELVGARYGALAVLDGDGRVEDFHTCGLTAEDQERIGRLPEGRGLLGMVFREGKVLRLDDLAAHPRAAGVPPHHPVMRNLLAAPIRHQERILGSLYLTEKEGGFTADDEDLVTTLCADAAVAIENARLMRDISAALEDLKVAREQVVRGETLRAVGELAAGAAHHLNNLLAVVVGRAQLLLRMGGDPALERSLKIVERAALDGAEVVRRVLQFSQARAGGKAAPVDLNRIAAEALEFTRVRWHDEAQSQGRLIETALEAGPIPPVAGQPSELREVVVNLILNAVDALPEGGRIVLTTWKEGPGVFLSVADTGIGMPPEVKARVFEPFFSTKGVRSTGLGLSVSHGIIQRHGGEIAIESEEGKGTTVTLRLPALEREEPVAEAPPKEPGRSARILIIDDEPEVREMLVEYLMAEGHSVTSAADGWQGIAKIEEETFDLVFTDLGMPGMTGWQVAEAVKSRFPGMPVVLITGWADTLEPGEESRVDGVLAKPFQIDGLRDLLSWLLSSTRHGEAESAGRLAGQAGRAQGSIARSASAL